MTEYMTEPAKLYLKMIQKWQKAQMHLTFTLELFPKDKNKQNLQILFFSHSRQICMSELLAQLTILCYSLTAENIISLDLVGMATLIRHYLLSLPQELSFVPTAFLQWSEVKIISILQIMNMLQVTTALYIRQCMGNLSSSTRSIVHMAKFNCKQWSFAVLALLTIF